MSTRAALKVIKTAFLPDCNGKENPNSGERSICFYHHFDGYTEGLGVELIQLILKLRDCEDLQKLTEKGTTVSSVRHTLRGYFNLYYENMSWAIENQGDLEYVYVINLDNGGCVLDVYIRNDFEKTDWQKWQKKTLLKIPNTHKAGITISL